MFKILLNDDMQIRNEIISKIKENDGYCICALEKNDDTKCMCKEFRECKEETECNCGLYRKVIM